MQAYTKELVHRLYALSFSDLSNQTRENAKMCVEDFVGVALAGAKKQEASIWRQYYADKATAPEATVLDGGFGKKTAEQAAALNAVAGHVLDLDDTHNASIVHLAAITVPTALALGQKLHKPGSDVLTAIVAGYEAGAKIGETINPSAYKYWHTTAVVGPFAAATVAAKLLGLTEEEMVHCFGSAGSQAAGLWEFLKTGAMTKVLHTANANLCGMRAAELARLGFTGAPEILEGERAFVKALAPEYHLERLTDFSQGLEIDRNSIKAYACCRHTHSANFCVEQMLKEQAIDPEKVVSIEDRTYHTAIETTNNPYPASPYAAKFSLQFCIAAMLVTGSLNDRVFNMDNLKNPAILRLMPKICMIDDPDINEAFRRDPSRWTHALTITMQDGTVIRGQVDYPIGDYNNAFDWEMEDRKYDMLSEGIERAPLIRDRLHRLESLRDVNDLFDFREGE
ncbi:MAG: MmgE/PrpD family protein [Clostridia bacterium]|nr:MmgE/PrpD family protein [Clostridia bacterium]